MGKLMVLGLGDVLNQDKGLGIYAVRDLYRDGWPWEVVFVHSMRKKPGDFLLQDCKYLLILFAWRTGQSPGTLHRFTLQELARDRKSLQVPEIWDTLTLAQLMGQCIEVLLLGLEPEQTACDLYMSSTLQDAYPQFLNQARLEMRGMLQEMGVNDKEFPAAHSL